MARLAWERAKNKANWKEDWKPPPDPPEAELLARQGMPRVEYWVEFLWKEFKDEKTMAGRDAIKDLLRHPEQSLEMLG